MWRDQPIENIEKWAKERGEKMVDYTLRRQYPSINRKKITVEWEYQYGKMPESFWNTFRFDNGWQPYKHTLREPKV